MNQFLLLETDSCTETRLGVTTVEGLQPNLYYIVGVTPITPVCKLYPKIKIPLRFSRT